jgi:RES domain
MVTGADLEAVIARLPSRPLRAGMFRAMKLRWATDPLGKRRPIFAGRFNVKDSARVLYFGDTHATCLSEVQALGAPHFAVAIIPVQIQLQAVIDLRDRSTLASLCTTRQEWMLNFRLRPNPTPSQALGEACARLGCVDGILYPSPAHAGGLDLAVIEASLLAGALTVHDPISGLGDHLP